MSRNVVEREVTARRVSAVRTGEIMIRLSQITMCARCVSEVCQNTEINSEYVVLFLFPIMGTGCLTRTEDSTKNLSPVIDLTDADFPELSKSDYDNFVRSNSGRIIKGLEKMAVAHDSKGSPIIPLIYFPKFLSV